MQNTDMKQTKMDLPQIIFITAVSLCLATRWRRFAPEAGVLVPLDWVVRFCGLIELLQGLVHEIASI